MNSEHMLQPVVATRQEQEYISRNEVQRRIHDPRSLFNSTQCPILRVCASADPIQDVELYYNHGIYAALYELWNKMKSPATSASKSEMRIVVAFDLDCFYAQVITVNNPKLAGRPVAVRQKYITVTCNYEARKYGITKLCNLEEAKTRCPDLLIVDGSDLTPFRQASEQIYNFWKDKASDCPIERKGFDECFLDLTKLVKFRLKSFTGPISFQGHVHGDLIAETKKDQDLVQMLAMASLIVQEWREKLRNELGYKCCAGISVGKLSAKFAAEMKKPNSQSIILPSSFPEYLANIPCSKLQGIGRSMYTKLLHAHEVENPGFANSTVSKGDRLPPLLCSHIRTMDYHRLLAIFDNNHKQASFVYNAVRGIDVESVKASSTFAKSISQEETSLPHPINWKDASARLRLLCERLLPLVRTRQEKTDELPCIVKVTILNKQRFESIDKEKSEHRRVRKRPTSESKQRKVLSSHVVFSSEDNLYKVAAPLLQELLVGTGKQKPFKLARINLAVAHFSKCSSNNKNATIHASFFRSSKTSTNKEEHSFEVGSELESGKRVSYQSKYPSSGVHLSQETSDSLIDPKDIDISVLEELPSEIRDEIKSQMNNYTAIKASPPIRKKKQRIDCLFKQIARNKK